MMQSITTIRSLKEKQRQEREELILQAAEEMLAEKGYHETSMDEIAVRVGIAKGTVYLHFPSKEDLVMAIFARGMLKLLEGVEASIAAETTTRAKMEAVLRFMYGGFFNKRGEALFSIFGSNSGELRRLFAEKKGQMNAQWEQLSARIGSLLEEGKAAGEFDTTIPTDVMLNAFFSLLAPKLNERLLAEGQMSPNELVKYLGRFYFKGITAI